ncbi:MAG: glycosyltransferase family 2 protein [Candidatus Lambdaproteobacteria bacterium]|nr:glycosyltransferase family 2 protein [Candidatus Lambdaproteobacteria bacterium]
MSINHRLLRSAREFYRRLPVPLRWKQHYLLPTIFRLTGGYFRGTGAYQKWISERNTPQFDHLADTYYRQLMSNGNLAFKLQDHTPKISIIILSFGQSKYTLACLQSVSVHTAPAPPFEVLVFDNGSSAEHLERIEKYSSSLCLLRSEENLGFAKGCNAAAAHARGEYLLFLNNDTLVTPGWLTALLHVMQAHADAGIVGPKLMYADGTLQEAGAKVLQDGHVEQRGKADDAHRPIYNRCEAVPYCTGAAILVRRDIFRAVDGFDESYAPAYYEDADLCFKFRQAGYETYYSPDALVIHREGGTSQSMWGDSGVAAVVERNRLRFLGKWKGELQQHAKKSR